MIKKILIIVLNIIIVAYLLYPLPPILDLDSSIKSTEPGDTVQLKNVSAYFTDLERQEVISFYQKTYLDKHPLSFKINHPPEKAKTIIRDTTQTYYLEEFIIPFKQSLFINGFDWQKDVFTKEDQKSANKMFVDGKEFRVKVTLKTFTTQSLFLSYLIILAIQIFIIKTPKVYKKIFKHD